METLKGKPIVLFGGLRVFQVFRFVGMSNSGIPNKKEHFVPVGPCCQKRDPVSFLIIGSHEGQYVVTGPRLFVDEDTPVVSAHEFDGFWPLDYQGIPSSIICDVGE